MLPGELLRKFSCKTTVWDFPGIPEVKTPYFQCRGYRFGPWSRSVRF